MKRFLNIVNRIWVIAFLVLMIYQLLVHGSTYSLTKNLILLSIIPIVLGPIFIQKVFTYTMSEVLKFFYFAFIMVALICGSVLEWYFKIAWFDLFAHFLSGIVTSLVALIILKNTCHLSHNNVLFTIFFILCVTLAVAGFWEFFEFFSDKIFGADAQFVATTGVDDTMTDMLIAFLGSILFSIYYFLRMRMNSKQFMKELDHIL